MLVSEENKPILDYIRNKNQASKTFLRFIRG